MQAPLSSTASGKYSGPDRPIPITLPSLYAVPPSRSGEQHALASLTPSAKVATPAGWGEPCDSLTTFLSSSETTLAEGRGLAHDAGNLLGALGLYTELLGQPGVLRQEHRHYAEELQMLSSRSCELIARLLNPATTERQLTVPKVRQGVPGSVELEAVTLPEVIERCRGLLNAVARRAVEVAYEAGAGLPVAVPRETIERILVNLTKNAAEASSDTGAITLRVSCREGRGRAGRVVLTVEDKGHGMSVAAVRVLMGAPRGGTEQGDAPGRDPQLHSGHGIGFQVVRELVGATGGRLRLESRTGSGTKVEIGWAVAEPSSSAESSPIRLQMTAAGRQTKDESGWAVQNAGGMQC